MSSETAHPLLAFEITVDCADAAALAIFWKVAVGYVEHGDPGPGTAWLSDPRGIAPHLCFIEVAEPKIVKNRVHIDLAVSGSGTPEDKWQRISDEAGRLRNAGATVLTEFTGRWITMADPEGNEFDVC
ncbi:MAG: VOC family protein [Jatrophihabitans sp.]